MPRLNTLSDDIYNEKLVMDENENGNFDSIKIAGLGNNKQSFDTNLMKRFGKQVTPLVNGLKFTVDRLKQANIRQEENKQYVKQKGVDATTEFRNLVNKCNHKMMAM